MLKAQGERYRDRITNPEDIFTVVRDIVGTRITCNTLNDVYAVAQEIKAVGTSADPERSLIQPCDDWEDDYIRKPKESGYRAMSLLVAIPIPIGGRREPVTCEVQIRTLLQHAWGELTHEDTYKPGVKVPDLVEVLSKRLATALAVLDEIAQDLRDALEKVEREAISSEMPAAISQRETAQATLSEEAPSTTSPAVSPSAQKPFFRPKRSGETPSAKSQPVATIGMVQKAFTAAFGREASVPESQIESIFATLKENDVASVETLAEALAKTQDAIHQLESMYPPLTLTDYGRLLYAPSMFRRPEEVNKLLEQQFIERSEQAKRETAFNQKYPVGRETLGTVVHVTYDYALVQLPEGDTGILHVTGMKSDEFDFVPSAEYVVKEGETVRVRIVSANAETKRIELRLVR